MRYRLKQIQCRPWTLSGLSVPLIESHYENNYGGALRRLNAISEQLESLDFAKTPAHVLNGLKREELVALNSTLLHELYFASLGGNGQPTTGMSEILARDFGSLERWRAEFRAMGYALGGGSGWVLLTYVPRDRRLINQYASEHSQSIASGVSILALDMYEHAYHIDFGANVRAYVDTFFRNLDWPALEKRCEDAQTVPPPRLLEQPEFGDLQGIGVEEVKAMMAAGQKVQVIDVREPYEREAGHIAGTRHIELVALPSEAGLYNDFHAQIVLLAKDVCTRRPICAVCPLEDVCLRVGVGQTSAAWIVSRSRRSVAVLE